MLKIKPFVVAVTGPESSGKTSLAAALALQLSAPCSPEFARYFVAHLGRPYEHADLEAIGRGQKAWENWYAQRSENLLILDTDWTVLSIWEHFRFEPLPTPFWRRGYGQPEPADLYILNAPDFPWEFDPLRENPADRNHLFNLYEQLLVEHNTNYLIADGPLEHRIKQVLGVLGF